MKLFWQNIESLVYVDPNSSILIFMWDTKIVIT